MLAKLLLVLVSTLNLTRAMGLRIGNVMQFRA